MHMYKINTRSPSQSNTHTGWIPVHKPCTDRTLNQNNQLMFTHAHQGITMSTSQPAKYARGVQYWEYTCLTSHHKNRMDCLGSWRASLNTNKTQVLAITREVTQWREFQSVVTRVSGATMPEWPLKLKTGRQFEATMMAGQVFLRCPPT